LTAGEYFENYLVEINFLARRHPMASMDEQILRATKEIVVKFIEGGRLSPAGFPDFFKSIYQTVYDTVKDASAPSAPDEKKRKGK